MATRCPAGARQGGWPGQSRARPWPAVKRAVVTVWCVDIDPGNAATSAALRLLDRHERDRERSFRRPRDGRRWAAARAALKLVLALHLRCRPHAVSVGARRHSKPFLRRPHRGLHFSVSHAEGVALIAVCASARVGVDVERIRPLDDLDAVAAQVLSTGELEALNALEGRRRDEAFFRYWTAKESIVKASGEGLSVDLATVEPFARPCGPRVPRVLGPRGGFVGALTVLCNRRLPLRIRTLVWEDVRHR